MSRQALKNSPAAAAAADAALAAPLAAEAAAAADESCSSFLLQPSLFVNVVSQSAPTSILTSWQSGHWVSNDRRSRSLTGKGWHSTSKKSSFVDDVIGGGSDFLNTEVQKGGAYRPLASETQARGLRLR